MCYAWQIDRKFRLNFMTKKVGKTWENDLDTKVQVRDYPQKILVDENFRTSIEFIENPRLKFVNGVIPEKNNRIQRP